MKEGGEVLDAGRIKDLGWRQGSILSSALIEDLIHSGTLPTTVTAEDILIVVSHDCDVTNPSLANEPSAELLLACLVPEGTLNGALTHGRNPRRFHFLVGIDENPKAVEARANDRFVIGRAQLASHEPDPSRKCSWQTRDEIVQWLIKRYHRAAFPDAFNDRIRKASKPIAKVLKAYGQDLREIFIAMDSWDELPGGKPYRLKLVATMTSEEFGDPGKRLHAQQALDAMEERLQGCSDIEIDETLLASEGDVSLDDIRYMERFDFDYLSVEDEES